jgi:hypothetical protein
LARPTRRKGRGLGITYSIEARNRQTAAARATMLWVCGSLPTGLLADRIGLLVPSSPYRHKNLVGKAGDPLSRFGHFAGFDADLLRAG